MDAEAGERCQEVGEYTLVHARFLHIVMISDTVP